MSFDSCSEGGGRKTSELGPARGERAEREALNISSMARSAGVTCVIETTGRGFKKVINSAVGEGCSHMLVMGDNELKDGIVSVKDLSTKEQTEIPVRDLENFFNDIIQGK